MKLQDSELIQKLKDMVKNERELLIEILRHLREVERRQLYLERGHSSMFAFCTETLGYSEQEAHVRIQAMRLMSSVPMVEEKIESGELSLSVAAKVQTNFRKANTPAEDKEDVIESVLGKSTRQADRELAERFPEAPKPEVMRAVSGGLTQMTFSISKACLEKLNRLKARSAHKNFEGRMDLLFEELVELGLERYEKVPKKKAKSAPNVNLSKGDAPRGQSTDEAPIVQNGEVSPLNANSEEASVDASKGYEPLVASEGDISLLANEADIPLVASAGVAQVADNPSDAAVLSAPKVNIKRSRYISTPVTRELWFRAGDQCEYVDSITGRRCSCRHGLQIDHIIEFSQGGSSEPENLQLLCGAHNRWRSRATG